jgi:predicted nucleic-acid-binding Zn-ribbon protein
MAVKCKKCGYELSTVDEVKELIDRISDWIEIIFRAIARVGAVGFFAGPMNKGPLKVPCPECGATGSWEDTD